MANLPGPMPAAEPEERWWDFEAVALDGSLAAYATLVLRPAERRAWWWAALVGDGRPLVSVVDLDVPPPRPPSLALRTEGLWAEVICESPGEHWSVGLEAFALGVDDPDEVLGAQRGERVPLGFDLGWEATAAAREQNRGYDVDCDVHGEVLVGAERLDLDGTGRHRSWRGRPTWPSGPPGGAVVLHRAPVLITTGEGTPSALERAVCRLPGGKAAWASWLVPG